MVLRFYLQSHATTWKIKSKAPITILNQSIRVCIYVANIMSDGGLASGIIEPPSDMIYNITRNLPELPAATPPPPPSIKHKGGLSARWASNVPLQWRHNERDGISNHQRLKYLLNRLSRHRSKNTSKFRVNGLCVGNPPVTGGFPSIWPVKRKMFPFGDVIMFVTTFITFTCGSFTADGPACCFGEYFDYCSEWQFQWLDGSCLGDHRSYWPCRHGQCCSGTGVWYHVVGGTLAWYR